MNREPELATLRQALDDARQGRPRLVLVEGRPGMGKTALVRRFLEGAHAVEVLEASGDEGEQVLAGGVINQVLSTPMAQSTVATAGGDPGPTTDAPALGGRLLRVLGALQHRAPAILLVDDAHWADSASLQAIAFAVRRLHADRVLALIVAREAANLPEGLVRLVDGDKGARLVVSGLGADDLARLAPARARELTRQSLTRLRDHTEGNPLYARALLEELPRETLEDPECLLPAPRSFAHVVMARWAHCHTDARCLVAAAAVLGRRSMLGTAARLAGCQQPLPALEQAISVGLLESSLQGSGPTVSFPHPLVRAAVYHGLGPAERGRLHLAAADVADEPAERLRHRVLASVAPDGSLSADLVRHGETEAERGCWSAAGWALSTAGRLHPDRRTAERLRLSAIEVLLLAGDDVQLQPLLRAPPALEVTAHRLCVEGRLHFLAGRLGASEQALRAAWAQCPGDAGAGVAARVAEQLGLVLLERGSNEEAARWCRIALARAPGGTFPPGHARLGLALALGRGGRADEAVAELALDAHVDAPRPTQLDALAGRGVVRLWSDDLVGAQRDLDAVLAAAERAPVTVRAMALAHRAELSYRSGAWDDAVVDLDRLTSTAEEAGAGSLATLAHRVAALPLAARGQWEAAAAQVAAAERSVPPESGVAVAHAAAAAAHLAACRGDHAAVVDAVGALVECGWDDAEPAILRWRPIHVHALVRLGRLEEAADALARFESVAAARGRRSALGCAAHARGVLEAARGERASAEAAFVGAVEHLDGLGLPFDLACARLAFGAFLRRLGRRRDAARQLGDALACFSRLRAGPFEERCLREVEACGLTPAKRRDRDPLCLTPRELAVARLAASGRTNQEIATALVVSVKTIEYHLGNVYGKLGVSGRSELAAELRGFDAGSSGTSDP